MIIVKNFLSKEECGKLIQFYKNNLNKTEPYKDRKKLILHDSYGKGFTNNTFLNTIIKKYQEIRPLDYLDNLEIVYWPEGNFMDWHDDTCYYTFSSITNLNSDYEGGRTRVENFEIEPKIGKLVLFESSKLHKVTRLEKNNRYVIGAWYKDGPC